VRILIVEDDSTDLGRLRRILRTGFPDAEVVEITRRKAFSQALAQDGIDVIISEYYLRWATALNLLKVAVKRAPQAVVIWVSRQAPAEAVAAGMKCGLSDYVSKQHLHTLVSAVRANLERTASARHAAERIAQLRLTEERLQAIAELTADYAYSLRIAPDGTLTYDWISPSFTALTGYTLATLHCSGAWPSIVHPDDVAVVLRHRDLWCAGQPDVSEFRIITQKGEERWWRDHGRPAGRDADGRVVQIYGGGQDITQHKRLEESWRQAQRVEAIGQLAGWMAHDFNNVLQGVLGYSDILLRRLAGRHPLRHYVQQIYNVADQGTLLTRQLIAVSHRRPGDPQVLDLGRVLINITPKLRHLLGEDIEMTIRIAPGLGRVHGEIGQVEQVLLNFVLNARDAMPQGGRLTITAENLELDEGSASQPAGISPGAYVYVTVHDTGCGMDAATLAHLFEPFFTVKEYRKSMGLGLFTIYSIITLSGGHITVESAVDKGTTFRIYLPRIEDSVALERAEQSPPPLLSHGETILLIEDEAVVRDLVRQVLQESGYTVLEATGGAEAVSLCQEYHGPIHLLLADIILPEMDGREVARHLTLLQPHMRILHMSGYAQDSVFGRGVAAESPIFLQKPFTPEALRRKVREALNAAG
jgi:two-component system, cell cycle sensor histidine kinase and response regulator CckA